MSQNCVKCRHFYVTYDQRTPRGCRVYGFETAQIPAMVVKRDSGQDCQAFEPNRKAQAQEAEQKMDLNDPKYWG